MLTKSKSNTSLFLLEMLMVCGFLLYCSSIFVQAFVKSDEISRLTSYRNNAILFSQTLAEDWKTNEFEIGLGETKYLSLDDEFNILSINNTETNNSNITCRVFCSELEESNTIQELNISVYNNKQESYSLTVSKFIN